MQKGSVQQNNSSPEEKGEEKDSNLQNIGNTMAGPEEPNYLIAKINAFYKLHSTSISEGRFEGEDFTYDLSRIDFVKRGDHYDFKLTKIPNDFGFIGESNKKQTNTFRFC